MEGVSHRQSSAPARASTHISHIATTFGLILHFFIHFISQGVAVEKGDSSRYRVTASGRHAPSYVTHVRESIEESHPLPPGVGLRCVGGASGDLYARPVRGLKHSC